MDFCLVMLTVLGLLLAAAWIPVVHGKEESNATAATTTTTTASAGAEEARKPKFCEIIVQVY